MAVYVTSDLHGLELSKLKALLKKVDFGQEDWLYILGDVIDRQNDGGVELLCWLTSAANVQLILGNHEAMLLSCKFLFEEISESRISQLDEDKLERMNLYLENGGDITLENLRRLLHTSPQTLKAIFEYLFEAPLYETVTAGERDFILCHGGFESFSPDKRLSDYTPDEILWARPEYDEEYYTDIITVFGHTPTVFYGREFKGRIVRRPTWIDVDVGVAYGNSPVLLRLDDLQEFYL